MELKDGMKLRERYKIDRYEIERYEIEGRYEIERYKQISRGR